MLGRGLLTLVAACAASRVGMRVRLVGSERIGVGFGVAVGDDAAGWVRVVGVAERGARLVRVTGWPPPMVSGRAFWLGALGAPCFPESMSIALAASWFMLGSVWGRSWLVV